MFDSLCELISYAVLVLIIVILYRHYVNGVAFPWMDKKSGFVGSSDGGCGSCSTISHDIPILKA